MKKLILIPLFLLVVLSCAKKKYEKAYAKIVSPANNSELFSNEEIQFVVEGKLSGVTFEFDELKFKITNLSNNKIVLEQDFEEGTQTISYTPVFQELTYLLVSAEYWREDSKYADKTSQIIISITP